MEARWPQATYAEGYERLRRHALEPAGNPQRQGLAVVACRGLAAWLGVVAALPVPAPAARPRPSAEPLPVGVESRAADIVLAMVRPHWVKAAA